MSVAYEIPLSPEPQSFQIKLGGTSYTILMAWNITAACWLLDILNADRVPLVQGIPVVTGVDLLGQYRYMNFGGRMIVQTDHNPNAVPTFENLGLEGHIFFVVG